MAVRPYAFPRARGAQTSKTPTIKTNMDEVPNLRPGSVASRRLPGWQDGCGRTNRRRRRRIRLDQWWLGELGERVSLTRAVGDSGQSTSRLCHFRLANGERANGRTGERVSLTRAVGDSGQSTSRLCHFRLIPFLRLISNLLRLVRPFNTRPTAPDSLSRSPISAKSAENAPRTSLSTHFRQTTVLGNHRKSPRWQSPLPPWPE